MKRILSLTLIVAMAAVAFVACKDDFNEEDFLKLQYELKEKEKLFDKGQFDSLSEEAVKEYIAAANEAGDLLAVSLIVRENGNALQGVTVTLSSGTPQEISSGRTKAVTTGTTDASGNVVFDRVTIGSGTATFSKTGYVMATATYDFLSPSAPVAIQVSNPNGNGTITKYVPPAKRFEEGVVQMISATPSEGSTATISGKVTIENDLTNLTPEVPAGIVLRANLTGLLAGNQGFFTSYTLADNSTLGRATIAADGSYTMVVPATAAGTTISFIIPNIEGTCRMAVNSYDGVTLPLPEYRNVPTIWGPGIAFSNTAVNVVGARVEVPVAPPLGSGLSFTFAPVGRSLVTGSITSSAATQLTDTYYRITNRGSLSLPITEPTVTISGGGGSGASAKANLQVHVPNATIANQGGGYDAQVALQFYATKEGGGEDILSTTNDFNIESNKLPAQLDLTVLQSDNGGFGSDEAPIAIQANSNYTGFFLRVINGGGGLISVASVTPNAIVNIASVQIQGAGVNYTSKPTFSFSHGGASIDVLEFPVSWDVTPVMGAGTDYSIMPSVTINYPQSHSLNGSSSPNVLLFHQNGSPDGVNAVDVNTELTISSGDIVKKNPTRSFRTATKSNGQPTVTISQDITPVNAIFLFDDPTNDINLTSGAIMGLPTATNMGNGYSTQLTGAIVPAVTGAPGSGATIKFKYASPATFTAGTNEWQFGQDLNNNVPNIEIVTPGSGYLRNLNQKAPVTSGLPASQSNVQAGKIYTVDFVYGSGQRRVAVQ